MCGRSPYLLAVTVRWRYNSQSVAACCPVADVTTQTARSRAGSHRDQVTCNTLARRVAAFRDTPDSAQPTRTRAINTDRYNILGVIKAHRK